MTLYGVIKLVVFGKLFYVTWTPFAALYVRPGQVWHHLSHTSWYFSVLAALLLEDSSAAINVLKLPLRYFLPLFYAVRDSLHRPLKRVWDSRSRLLNDIAFSIRKESISYIVNPTGKEHITTWALTPKCAIMDLFQFYTLKKLGGNIQNKKR